MLTIASKHDNLIKSIVDRQRLEGVMRVDTSALKDLAHARGWSIPELAVRLQIDYSYLFRILKGQKTGGAKLFAGVYRLCQQEGLTMEDYVLWDDEKDWLDE